MTEILLCKTQNNQVKLEVLIKDVNMVVSILEITTLYGATIVKNLEDNYE